MNDSLAGDKQPSTPRAQLKRTQEVQSILLSALTGRTVLLPTDDAAEYERHIRAYQDELKPVGQRESDLVKDCANCAIASLPTAGGVVIDAERSFMGVNAATLRGLRLHHAAV